MTILLIGDPQENHLAVVAERLKSKGESTFCFDSRRFPWEIKVHFSPDDPYQGYIADLRGGMTVPLKDITAAYWRYYLGVFVPDNPPPELAARITETVDSTAQSFFYSMSHWHWVNPPQAIAEHRFKIYQMQVIQDALKSLGLRVPQTIYTGDPQALQIFYSKLNKQVIHKTMQGGGEARLMNDNDLSKDGLISLLRVPVQFQEYIAGTDIAVYVIGQTVFATEIESKAVDFRTDSNRKLKPIQLPDEINQACLAVSEALNQPWSLIDIRRTDAGEYVFIEGNPSPKFLDYEQATGYPITETLVNFLMQKK